MLSAKSLTNRSNTIELKVTGVDDGLIISTINAALLNGFNLILLILVFNILAKIFLYSQPVAALYEAKQYSFILIHRLIINKPLPPSATPL